MSWDGIRFSYERVANDYEARFVDELASKPRDRELLEAFAAAVGDPVVDLGCGPGQIGSYLREHGRRVIGADISIGMAALAAHRLDVAVAADLRYLPLGTASVGGIVAFYSLIHVPRPQLRGAFSELARVLEPGGQVLLSAHEGEGEIEQDEFLGARVPFVATLFELDELVTAARTAGFAVMLAERRPPYPGEHETFRLYVQAERLRAPTQ